jgi:hypothetical protein
LTKKDNKQGVKEKNKFIDRAVETFGLEKEEVIELLKNKFQSFNEEATSTYLAYLNTVAQDRWLKAFEERRKEDGINYIKNCPYHPKAEVRQDLKTYSRYTKTVGFLCSEGDRQCYIRWKMDEMFKATGRDPIDWDDFDANKEIIIKKRLEEA